MSKATSPLLTIAAVCAFAGPILILISDIFRIATGRMFEWSIILWLAFVVMIPAVIGLTWSLAAAGSRLAYPAGAFAFFGLMAGASMQVLFRVYAVLVEQGSMQTVEQLRSTFKLVASTQMIGLAWPLGLLLLAVSYYLVRRSLVVPLLLVAGAISFPIGRIAGSEIAVIISGLTFIVAFGIVGKQLWERSSEFA